jgi:hypothetical protein
MVLLKIQNHRFLDCSTRNPGRPDPSPWTTGTLASFLEGEALPRKSTFFLSIGTGVCLGIRKVIGHALVPSVVGLCVLEAGFDADTKSVGLCSAFPRVGLLIASCARTDPATALRQHGAGFPVPTASSAFAAPCGRAF